MSTRDLRDPDNQRFVLRNAATAKARHWERQVHGKDCGYGQFLRRMGGPWPLAAYTVETCSCFPLRRLLALHRASRFADRVRVFGGRPLIKVDGLKSRKRWAHR
jgi:hypothetical protein